MEYNLRKYSLSHPESTLWLQSKMQLYFAATKQMPTLLQQKITLLMQPNISLSVL